MTFIKIIVLLLTNIAILNAQIESTVDTIKKSPDVIGGIYDRPYISRLADNIAIGGYAEMNSNFMREEGIEEGISFEARRFNIFLYSPISERVKLTSELEFEHGTEEINLETALVDILFHTSINLRAGILLSPIGRFNIAHDSPRYDIIDRPLVSTEIIPATLSEVGFGFFGAFYPTQFNRVTYEIYIVNGLNDGVVGGSGEGTRISSGKSLSAFEEDNNGSPAFTGRLAINPGFGGEFGISFHSGNYNSFKAEGDIIDESRRLTILAADWEYRKQKVYVRGEGALAYIDVQKSLMETFADKQHGLYAEAGYTFLRKPILGWQEVSLTFISRFDYIDLNVGKRRSTNENIGDSVRRLTAGISFRPTADTSIRVSFARSWQYDQFNNLANHMNLQFGIATYF